MPRCWRALHFSFQQMTLDSHLSISSHRSSKSIQPKPGSTATPSLRGTRVPLFIKVEGVQTSSAVLSIFVVILFLSVTAVAFELTPSIRQYAEAVSGNTAELSCKLPAVTDRPSLVLWYKDYSTKPFYSFDAREHPSSGRHKIHKDWQLLGKRTNFTFKPGTYTKDAATIGTLALRNVTLADAGNYTCRVDFYTAQTAMTLMTLNVYEGVRRLSVVDESGREVGGQAGPYTETQTLKLICTARGGYPPPTVVWMMDGLSLPKSLSSSYYHHPVSPIDVSGGHYSPAFEVPSTHLNDTITSNDILPSRQHLPLYNMHLSLIGPNRPAHRNFRAFHSVQPSRRFYQLRNSSRKFADGVYNRRHLHFPPVRLNQQKVSNISLINSSSLNASKTTPFSFYLPYHRSTKNLTRTSTTTHFSKLFENKKDTKSDKNKASFFILPLELDKSPLQSQQSSRGWLRSKNTKAELNEHRERTSAKFLNNKLKQRREDLLNTTVFFDEQEENTVGLDLHRLYANLKDKRKNANHHLSPENSYQNDSNQLTSKMETGENEVISEKEVNYSISVEENLRHLEGSIKIKGKKYSKTKFHKKRKRKRSLALQTEFQPLGDEERDSLKYFETDLQSSFEVDDTKRIYVSANDPGKSKLPLKNMSASQIKFSYSSGAVEEEVQESTVSSVLEIGPLTRTDNGKVFTCWADNSKLTAPKTRQVTLNMLLPPTRVSINTPTVGGIEGVQGVVGVVANRESVLVCRAEGSIPPAIISWSPSSLLTPLSTQPTLDQNATVSRARIMPVAEDDGQTVTCTATNPKVAEYTVTATHKLQVKYPPIVEAHLAPALDPLSIKEGVDVYFECRVNANPPAGTVVWLHEDKQLEEGQWGNRSTVILHGHNLVLQRVTRQAKGTYTCRASNSLGTVSSAPAMLNIMYPPVCLGPPNQTISIAPGHPTTLVCKVDSYPQQVRFRWAVNTSRGLSHVDPSRFTSKNTMSYLVYKPQLTLSQEAEQMRNVYYINKKLGFYGGGNSGGPGTGGGMGGNNRNLKGESTVREVRDTSRKVPVEFENKPFTYDYQRYTRPNHVSSVEWMNTQQNVNSAVSVNKIITQAGVSPELINLAKDKHFIETEHANTFYGSDRSAFERDTKEDFFREKSNGEKSANSKTRIHSSKKNSIEEETEKVREEESGSGEGGQLTMEEIFVGLEETYGVVYCWGENVQGKQQQPCVMTVTPAGPPSPIRACRILNQTATALQVLCKPGNDGGLRQAFAAMVLDEASGSVVDNVTSLHPLLTLGGLTAGTDYVVKVWAFNSRGASKPFILEGYALKVAENKIDNTEDESTSQLPAVFVAVFSGFILVIGCLVLTTRLRSRRRRPRRSESDEAPKTSVSDNEEEANTSAVKDQSSSEAEQDIQLTEVNEPDLLLRPSENVSGELYHPLAPNAFQSLKHQSSPQYGGDPCMQHSGQNSDEQQHHLRNAVVYNARSKPTMLSQQQRPRTPLTYSQPSNFLTDASLSNSCYTGTMKDTNSLTNCSPAQSISLKASSSDTSGAASTGAKNDSGIHTPSLNSGNSKFSKSSGESDRHQQDMTYTQQFDTSRTSLIPSRSIDNLRSPISCNMGQQGFSNISPGKYISPGNISPGNAPNGGAKLETHHRKDCDNSLLSYERGGKHRRNIMDKSFTFDKEHHIRGHQHSSSKVPFTGSAVTRDPPFHYATICRGFSAASDGKNDDIGKKSAALVEGLPVPRVIQRGNSSHELLVAATSISGNSGPTAAFIENAGLSKRSLNLPASVMSEAGTGFSVGEGSSMERTAVSSDGQRRLSRNICGSKMGVAGVTGSSIQKPSQEENSYLSESRDGKSSRVSSSIAEQKLSHEAQPQFAPLQSVVDLPKVVSGAHKYYTLKISNTRHNNESFV